LCLPASAVVIVFPGNSGEHIESYQLSPPAGPTARRRGADEGRWRAQSRRQPALWEQW
jgi:hypothetical protein